MPQRPAGSCEDSEIRSAPIDRATRKKHLRSIFLAILVGLAINVFMGLILDFKQFMAAFAQVSIPALIAPFVAILCAYLIDSLRYRIVFRKFGIRVSFRDSLYNNVLGNFFSNITPGSIGGQPFQILHFSKLGLDATISSNVVVSRLMESNIVQLLIVAVFFHKGIGMMAVVGKGAFLLIAGMIATIFMTFVLLMSFLNPHKLGELALSTEKSRLGRFIAKISRDGCWAEKAYAWSQKLGDGFKLLWHHNTWTMVLDIGLLLVDQMLWAAGLYIPLAHLTGAPVPFPEFLLSFILCGLISLFIPTPGASGSVEASYLLVLSALTGKPAATLSAILIWRFGSYYLHLLLGGLVYFLFPQPEDSVYKADAQGLIRRIRPSRSKQSP